VVSRFTIHSRLRRNLRIGALPNRQKVVNLMAVLPEIDLLFYFQRMQRETADGAQPPG
jgi:hypothetical protein